MPSKSEEKNSAKILRKYLQLEYEHIAKAHFKTIETISTFFKHYLVLITISIIIVYYIISNAKNIKITEFFEKIEIPTGLFLILVSLAGLAVTLYIINLRLDALLYARTINGIRNYFYDIANIDIKQKVRIMTLPQSTFIPKYF